MLLFFVDWELGHQTFSRNVQLVQSRWSNLVPPALSLSNSVPNQMDISNTLQLGMFLAQPVPENQNELRGYWRMQAETAQQLLAINATLTKALRYITVPGIKGDRNISYVVAISGNYAYREHVLNTLCIMHRVGIKTPIVISLDRELAAYLNQISPDILTVHFQPPLGINERIDEMFTPNKAPSTVVNYNSVEFADVTSLKLYAVYRLLKLGYRVVFSDSDIMYCDDAAREAVRVAEQYLSHASSDIVFQSDSPGNLICTGFYYARPTWKSMYFLETVLVENRARGSEDDQSKINRLLCDPRYGGRREGSICYRDSLKSTMYSTATFNNGAHSVMWKNQIEKRLWYYPRNLVMEACKPGNEHGRFMLHNNHIWPGSKKKDRFIVKGFWFAQDLSEIDKIRKIDAITVAKRVEVDLENRSHRSFHSTNHRLPNDSDSGMRSTWVVRKSKAQAAPEYMDPSSYTSKICRAEPREFNEESFTNCGSDCGDP